MKTDENKLRQKSLFQETKVGEEKLPEEMKNVDDYSHSFWLAAEKDGYSAVGKQPHFNDD